MVGSVWDPFGTLGNALWIGGAQWAGKTTVAQGLAVRYGVTVYHYDFHDARAHEDRRVAARARNGEPIAGPNADTVWVRSTPEEMAAETLAGFDARFAWALDDLRALVSGRPIIAEGWGLRPELVAPLLDSPDRMIVMIPTAAFRQRQIRTLPRAGRIAAATSDPELAQRNRLERDRLIAQNCVESARRLGIEVLEIDGAGDPDLVTDRVAEHFRNYLT